VIASRGKPTSIVSDNGTELTSNAILAFTVNRRSKLTPYRRPKLTPRFGLSG
jgi:hypothetical protein